MKPAHHTPQQLWINTNVKDLYADPDRLLPPRASVSIALGMNDLKREEQNVDQILAITVR